MNGTENVQQVKQESNAQDDIHVDKIILSYP